MHVKLSDRLSRAALRQWLREETAKEFRGNRLRWYDMIMMIG